MECIESIGSKEGELMNVDNHTKNLTVKGKEEIGHRNKNFI